MFSLLLLLIMLMILGLVCIMLLILCAYQTRDLPKSKRTLLITAHPDDETMFFSPTIQGLLAHNTALYLLCISTGNAEGLGTKRKYELLKAAESLGIMPANVMLLDYDHFQDGQGNWEREELGRVILKHIKMWEVDSVVTFDEFGISEHPNHVACFKAMQYLYTYGYVPAGVQVFVLETVALGRKYCLPLDACISAVHSTFLYVTSPWGYLKSWQSMFKHRSQLVWFRGLYMLFSRYICINTLKRIRIEDRFCKFKNKKA